MPDFRAVIALDIAAETKEAARQFATEIVQENRARRRRKAINETAKKNPIIYGSDLIELRDR